MAFDWDSAVDITEEYKKNKKTEFDWDSAVEVDINSPVVSQGLLKSAQEGLTFGLADALAGVGGYAGAKLYDVTHLKNPYSKENLKANTAIAAAERKSFNDTKKAYEAAHPQAALVAELLGSFPTAALPIGQAGKAYQGASKLQKIASTLKSGAVPGALFGAGYGAGNAWTQNEELTSKEAIRDALLGTGYGASFGAGIGAGAAVAAPAVTSAVRGVYSMFSPTAKAANTIERIGKPKFWQAINDEVPLLDIADENIIELAEKSRLNNTRAKQIYRDYADKRRSQQVDKVNDLIENTFGKKGYKEVLQEIEERGQRRYMPLYNKAMKHGEVAGVLPEIVDSSGVMSESLLTPPIREVIQKIRKDPKFYQYAKYKDNDIRVLDLAKQYLDDQIAAAGRKEEFLKQRILVEQKNKLLEEIDKQVPIYQTARKEFAKTERVKDILDDGRKFDKMTREEVDLYNKNLNRDEKQAFYAGIRERLVKNLDDGAKSTGVNVARRVFDDATLRKLESLNIDNFSALEKAARAERKAIDNINRFTTGSQTAERENIVRRTSDILSPTKIFRKTIDKIGNKINGLNDEKIAEILTANPQKLQEIAEKAGRAGRSVKIDPQISGKYLAAIKQIERNKNIPDADKKILIAAQKKAAREEAKKYFEENLRGEQVKKKGLKNPVEFRRKTFDKIGGTSSDISKLDLLPYSKELIRQGKITPIEALYKTRRDDKHNFRGLITDVDYPGRFQAYTKIYDDTQGTGVKNMNWSDIKKAAGKLHSLTMAGFPSGNNYIAINNENVNRILARLLGSYGARRYRQKENQ